MQTYRVISGPVQFHQGAVLKLSAAQIEPRAHALDVGHGGVCAVLSPIEFKTGEVFGLEGEPTRVFLERAEAVGKAPAKKKAAPPAKPAAKPAKNPTADAPPPPPPGGDDPLAG